MLMVFAALSNISVVSRQHFYCGSLLMFQFYQNQTKRWQQMLLMSASQPPAKLQLKLDATWMELTMPMGLTLWQKMHVNTATVSMGMWSVLSKSAWDLWRVKLTTVKPCHLHQDNVAQLNTNAVSRNCYNKFIINLSLFRSCHNYNRTVLGCNNYNNCSWWWRANNNFSFLCPSCFCSAWIRRGHRRWFQFWPRFWHILILTVPK